MERLLQQQLFCPPFMTRVNFGQSHLPYTIAWMCRICLKFLLSKDAAIQHASACRLSITKLKDIPVAKLEEMTKNKCFPCKYCREKMRTKYAWIKHLNEHEAPDYNTANWGVDG